MYVTARQTARRFSRSDICNCLRIRE